MQTPKQKATTKRNFLIKRLRGVWWFYSRLPHALWEFGAVPTSVMELCNEGMDSIDSILNFLCVETELKRYKKLQREMQELGKPRQSA